MFLKRYTVSKNCIRCELCINHLPNVFQKKDNGQSEIKRQYLLKSEREKMDEIIKNCPISGIQDHFKKNS